ncbi:FHA domain-containing protein [Aphanothece hegewaldii]|uniref:FHA domain-containing protein n=1 Tax=Aphanothece hegewaldii TaxID=1521625 RepID=UPI002481A4D4|nr:FHA domain-containing protein [Aphanothece hegewaldii]
MGRDPSQCKILIPDDRTLVSGRHLEIEPIQEENTPKWLLCDMSRHGTYLNGNRLNECQILQDGDRITLGEAKLTPKSAQFTFNYSSQVTLKKELVSPLSDCDIFCLLLAGEQSLSDDERWLLTAATQAEITHIIIILEISSADVAVAKKIEVLANELETWFKEQYLGISVEIVALLLQPFLVNTEVKEIESYFQKSLDKMTKSLETLVKRKPEDLLTQRLTARFQFQLTKIEQLLEKKKATFFKEIGSTESDTQELSKDELKERLKKACKDADTERDKFFKRVKTELNQSKASLLDEFNRVSLITQIKQFVTNLEPTPTYADGYCELKLQLSNHPQKNSVALAAISLCREELERWSITQWEGICYHYGKGGLQGLHQTIHDRLNGISSLKFNKSLFEFSQSINFQSILHTSVVIEEIETKYKQPNIIGYLFKNLRGQIISVLGMVVIIGGAFLPKSIDKNKLIPLLLLPIIIATFFAYKQDKITRLEEETEKIKERMIKYYELFSKKLVDNLIEKINLKLEEQERKIKEILETVDEQYKVYLAELDKKQLEVKSITEQSKLQQKALEKEIAELQKLKSI